MEHCFLFFIKTSFYLVNKISFLEHLTLEMQLFIALKKLQVRGKYKRLFKI